MEFVEEQSIVKLDRVLYVPDLGYNLFFSLAAFNGVTYDKIGGPEKIMTAFGGDVVFRLGSGSLLSSTARRIAPSAAPKALSAIAHCKEQYVDVNDFHRIHAHANLMRLIATTKRLNVELSGELLPCVGCVMGKAIRRGVPISTKTRAQKRLWRVFVDMTGLRRLVSVGGVHYVMIVRDDYTRYTWLFGLKSKSASATAFAFREFLADVRADVMPSSVEIVRTDNGSEFTN